MNWYDNVSDGIIERMKTNEYSHRMLKYNKSPALANAFELIPDSDLVYFAESGWATTGGYLKPTDNNLFTYRLREDWERPKREAVLEGKMIKFCGYLTTSRPIASEMAKLTEGWPEGNYKITIEEQRKRE